MKISELFLSAGLALALGTVASAALATEKADPAVGRELIYSCAGCHGIPGYRNAYPNYRVPKLGGQKATYIIAALHAYASGERQHATMHAQASTLSEQQISDIAAYIESATSSE